MAAKDLIVVDGPVAGLRAFRWGRQGGPADGTGPGPSTRGRPRRRKIRDA